MGRCHPGCPFRSTSVCHPSRPGVRSLHRRELLRSRPSVFRVLLPPVPVVLPAHGHGLPLLLLLLAPRPAAWGLGCKQAASAVTSLADPGEYASGRSPRLGSGARVREMNTALEPIAVGAASSFPILAWTPLRGEGHPRIRCVKGPCLLWLPTPPAEIPGGSCGRNAGKRRRWTELAEHRFSMLWFPCLGCRDALSLLTGLALAEGAATEGQPPAGVPLTAAVAG